MNNEIIIKGAKENNLKNIDIKIPKNKFVVITGVSGSGKSSLAFDTIYAEGNRRYVESLSSYARQFLGGNEKPDVDSIDGLSPSISIDQKTTNKNPRSTVGTITEIYDYLRLLYSKIGKPFCPVHNIEIKSQTVEEMVDKILSLEEGKKIRILSPVVNNQKGEHSHLIEELKKEGFARIRINGKEKNLHDDIEIDKHKKDTIELVVDRLVVKEDIRSRLNDSVELALKKGEGKLIVDVVDGEEILMSENYACPHCDFSLPYLEPSLFSFNSPFGACPSCNGLGVKLSVDPSLVVLDESLSLNKKAIPFISENKNNIDYKKLKILCNHYSIDMDKPFKKLTKKQKELIFYGTNEIISFSFESKAGASYSKDTYYEGIINNLERRYVETNSQFIRDWIKRFMVETTCEKCEGKRLNENALAVKVDKKSINELTNLSIKDLYKFFDEIKLNEMDKKISDIIIKEIKDRLKFLIDVGLSYLALGRMAGTLSGGEAQRIRLATQIGSKLSGVLYVLDEPSIGLHQRDNEKLITTLKSMRDLGNSLIVVEHDIDTMINSDYLIDIGPLAGDRGGEVIAAGTYKEVADDPKSITGKFLSGKEKIDVPTKRRKGNGKFLEIKGAKENNLKEINVKIPLGKMVCITGVSGSGKSSLINGILFKAVHNKLYGSKEKEGIYNKILGLNNIDKVVDISQTPIGRTPRSNPATYTGVFDNIRDVFVTLPESKKRGYNKGRFSFNVKGGRCEVCRGDGVKKIEMHFLPDVYVECDSCKGKRYNKETLKIKYKGKNIADVLDMRVSEALEFFENHPKIKRQLKVLEDVGLGYIKLGQSAPLLSGGEAARVKLAKELQKKPTGKSLFILDEPTTGLHSYDVKKLLVILNKIVDNGDTVVVIEHNLDVIKRADHIIDLGPEGGDEGGQVIAKGTPEQIAKVKESYTGQFLKKVL